MNRALTALHWMLLLLAAVGVAATIVPTINGDIWWVRTLDFPRLQFLIGMAAAAALLLAMRSRRNWMSRAAICALAAARAYDVFLLIPYSSVAREEQIAAASCPPENRLRLLEVNVQMTNRRDHRLLELVRRADPDVAWFQETDAWWTRELSPLRARMRFAVVREQPNYYGVALFSKLPLSGAEVRFLTGSHNPSVFTRVTLRSGQVVKLYAVHPRPPQAGQGTAERDGQLLAMALAARADAVPHLVVGDMNAVPWEGVIHHARRVGRFLDPRIGRGLNITWNANSALMRWPLDQILPGPEFRLLSLKVLPAFGSDHLPYLAEFCHDGAAATRQPAPSLEPGDLEAAREAVREGQGEADKVGYKGRIGL